MSPTASTASKRDASALDDWVAAQTRFSTTAALAAISATHLVMERPGFGQRIVPQPGSVLASPAVAHYDPEPDYFFHWFRDSAIVIDALRVALTESDAGGQVLERLAEFVDFSLRLRASPGATFLRDTDLAARTQPAYREYLRPEAELAALSGSRLATDVRVNADGTPDFLRWGRPQFDGPALRYITLLRWERDLPQAHAPLRARLGELSDADLTLTLECADEPGFDIWEEQRGHHYYTQLVQAEALRLGVAWCERHGQAERAGRCHAAEQRIARRLEASWNEGAGFYRARTAIPPEAAGAEPDIAVILAVLHAGRTHGPHSVLDPRVQSTLSVLEDLFEHEYPINRGLPPERAPAMGRYASDRYFGGGAWFVATLAAAEFYFQLASALRAGAALVDSEDNRRFRERLASASAATAIAGEPLATVALRRGDAFLRTVQAFAPPGGELSEQFDRTTGAATSARHLTWSYAAFITAAASRAQVLRPTAA
jgi:glucoamylase